jgi:choline-glycine betaine transporter
VAQYIIYAPIALGIAAAYSVIAAVSGYLDEPLNEAGQSNAPFAIVVAFFLAALVWAAFVLPAVVVGYIIYRKRARPIEAEIDARFRAANGAPKEEIEKLDEETAGAVDGADILGG